MKKVLLALSLIFPLTALAQQETKITFNQSKKANLAVQEIKALSGNEITSNTTTETNRLNKTQEDVYNFVLLGKSYYDLQSNASVGRRIIVHDDGSISTVWTTSPNTSTGWPQRGTGYNYFGGSWGAETNTRVENARTGWPSINIMSDGSVTTIAHRATDGGFIKANNGSQGGTNWTSSNPLLTVSNGVPIWNRSGSNGDTIHLICNFYSNSDDGIDEYFIDGIRNPTTYSRSLDGGNTWDIKHSLLPGYDTSRYLRGSGDAYAIDVQGNTVAIVIGGIGNDLSLWKSMDYGNTWTKTVCDSFRYAPYDLNVAIASADAGFSNDGSIDVVIDNNGEVHVVCGAVMVYDATGIDDQSYNIPQTYELFYWSETNTEIKSIGKPIDMDNQIDPATNLAWYFPDETTVGLDATGNPQGGAAFAGRYGGLSIPTHPSITVDANNNIYVTYDCPVELLYHDFGANLRDIHIVYSQNGGADWSDIQNLTQARKSEVAYGSMARRADNFIHIIFQLDDIPGTHLQNNGGTGLHPNNENRIYYAAVPVQDVLDNKLGQHLLSTEEMDSRSAELFVVSQNQPNPFSGSSEVLIYNSAASVLTLTITDMFGKVVRTEDLGKNIAGNHVITLDANGLTSGMYFYTIASKDHQVTRKMQVR